VLKLQRAMEREYRREDERLKRKIANCFAAFEMRCDRRSVNSKISTQGDSSKLCLRKPQLISWNLVFWLVEIILGEH